MVSGYISGCWYETVGVNLVFGIDGVARRGWEIGDFGSKTGEILRDGIASGRGVHRF